MLRNLISIAIIRFNSTYYHGLNSRRKKKKYVMDAGQSKLLLPQMLSEWELTKQM
jgi:hypothetical protein